MKITLALEGIIHPLGIWVRRGLPNRAWDWPAAGMTVALVLMASGRLMITNWVPSLEIVQTLSLYAVILGLVLGYSSFTLRNATWAIFEYGILILPFLLLRAVDGYESRYAALISIGARLLNSLKLFLTAEPVYDTLFFLCLTSIGFWMVGAFVGFSSARHRNYLRVVLPPGLIMLIVQLYDPWIPLRAWGLAFYLFTSLVLLGRLHYLEKQMEWRKKRVFLSSESEGELSRSVLATAAILVFAAWVLPGALRSIEPAAQTWKNFTEPIVERLSDAVSALDSPYGAVAGENFYGSMLNLGSNAPVSDAPVFHVKVGEVEVERSRYYWRGRTYDVYENGSWTNTNSVHQSFDPGQDEIELIEPFKRIETQFQFTYYFPSQRLIYSPSELIWMDRRGQHSLDPHPFGRQDIHAWFTETSLTAGEAYQVRAQIANPTILDLQDAGSDYPAWITEKYLQVPQDLAPQLRELTEQITAPFGTPYGKTQAVTSYLRKEITYEDTLTEGPPPDADPLMWVLFDYKKGFCMYYATAEVLMLRTIGIPARMAVGFAQGEYDPETDQFIVARRNSHAWPEVYFPGIGWVEFEPTANQDPLRRQRGNIEAVSASGEGLDGTGDSPVPGEETPGGAQDQVDLLDEELELLLDMESRALGGDAPAETMLTNPWWGLSVAGLFLMLVIAGLILERRYSLSTQLPVYLVRRYEQGADKPPPWLVRWAKWSALSPVERYFYVINHSLRTLGEKPAFHSTPAERTSALKELLPAAREAIEVLEGEHERALFTSHKADLSRARRAALKILLAAWHARLTNRGII